MSQTGGQLYSDTSSFSIPWPSLTFAIKAKAVMCGTPEVDSGLINNQYKHPSLFAQCVSNEGKKSCITLTTEASGHGVNSMGNYNTDEELTYGSPRIMSEKCFSVSSFISFLLISLVTGKAPQKSMLSHGRPEYNRCLCTIYQYTIDS